MLPIWVSVCVWRGGGLLADRVTNGTFKPVKESVHHSRKRAGGVGGSGGGKKEGEKKKQQKQNNTPPPLQNTIAHERRVDIIHQ